MTPLHQLLDAGAAQPIEGKVYVKGGWVDRVCSVPTEAGVEAVVRFAQTCWLENIRLQTALLALQHPEKGPDHAEAD